jgi:Ser/Thr protein kinase RdoA (MazF antagonist)
MARFYGYDTNKGVVILELHRGAEDLRSMEMRTGRFSSGLAAVLGRALGTLDRTTRGQAAELLPVAAPWVLTLHRPGADIFRDVSAGGLQVIRIVQGAAGFPEALDRARERWCLEAVIHGDLKWDNCLVNVHQNGGELLRLIDWESAAPGDPCWDIGSALSQYLSVWLSSIPNRASATRALSSVGELSTRRYEARHCRVLGQ